jgi:chromodomain-helicase-DNA-binding protein 4
MSQGSGPGSLGSEDPDAMAAQLLRQFSGFTAQRISESNEPRNEEEVQGSHGLKTDEQVHYSLEVVVPTVTNSSNYKYLPGHFAVRRILKMNSDNPKTPLYTVRLKSGERQTVGNNY